MAKRKQPKFYFSLRSPYSWLAYRRLLRDYADVAEAVQWVPFWEPDERSERVLTDRGETFPYSAMSRAKHLYILQDVRRLATAEKVDLSWPVDVKPVWEVPHLAYLVALDQGKGREFIAEAYRLRWEQGTDICDPATMANLGRTIGIAPSALAKAAEDDDLRARGVRILQDICADGVFGVPFFVHGFTRFWGVDRLADFADHVRAKLAPAATPNAPRPVTVGLGRSTDEGHAGGCG